MYVCFGPGWKEAAHFSRITHSRGEIYLESVGFITVAGQQANESEVGMMMDWLSPLRLILSLFSFPLYNCL